MVGLSKRSCRNSCAKKSYGLWLTDQDLEYKLCFQQGQYSTYSNQLDFQNFITYHLRVYNHSQIIE